MSYDSARLARRYKSSLMSNLVATTFPPFYQLIFEFPKNRLLHTPSFVGMHYTDDLIILEFVFLEGRSFGHAANTGALKVIIEA